MAVGIFDSGLGGLTVLDAVQKQLPEVEFLYYADSAHAPYGVRDAEDIFQLTRAAVEDLWSRGCDLVILACNTASAAALRRMQESWVPKDKRVPEVKDSLKWEFARNLALIEKRIKGPFVMGEEFTIADIVLCHCLNWAYAAKFPIESEAVLAYGKAMRSRDAYRRVAELSK